MNQQKILLLENVATQAAGVREHLSQAGFHVAVSRYEADGLNRLVEWVPDLVLVSTAHPAGDFVEYCRRVRELAPTVRIIVTSSLDADRLFHEYPGLQSIVDGVLLRPYSYEEVVAALAPVPAARRVPADDPESERANADLRTEFQSQLDARFLEMEELKRHLEVATRRAASAPGLEWLQSENEHLRQGVEEAKKKSALALATEQLKRSEIEVKLDNLLRMKEAFEFRAENEIEERTREVESVRAELQQLRAGSDKNAGEHASLRAELERTLVEKEQIEERLHALEAAGPAEPPPPTGQQEAVPRIAELEAEVSRQRALLAEGQLVLADIAAKSAILEASLACQLSALEERDQLLAQLQTLREHSAATQAAYAAAGVRTAALEQEVVEVRQARASEAGIATVLQNRLTIAEEAAADAQAAQAAAGERSAALEQEVAEARQVRASDAERVVALQNRLGVAEETAAAAQVALAAAGEGSAALEQELTAARQTCASDRDTSAALRKRLALAEEAAAAAQAALAATGEGRATIEKDLTEARAACASDMVTSAALQKRLALAEEAAAAAQTALAAAGEGSAALEQELTGVRAACASDRDTSAALQQRLTIAEEAGARSQEALAAARERRAVLEQELEQVREARAADARQAQLHQSEVEALTQELLDRAAGVESRCEQLQAERAGLEARVTASDAARVAASAQAAVLEGQRAAQIEGLNAGAAERERELAQLRAYKAQAESEESVGNARLIVNELSEARDRVRDLAVEHERLSALLAQRENDFAGESRVWHERAAGDALEIQRLSGQEAERAGREEQERRAADAREEQARTAVQALELQIAALREELAAAGESRRRDLQEFEARVLAAAAAAREEGASREVVAPEPVELRRIQELLEEVITRARTEAVDYARRDADLSARLQAALDERRLLQERFDRASAEATERERRAASLLQSAIDHGPALPAERANLPAVVPLEPTPAKSRLKPALAALAALAVVTGAVLLAGYGMRRTPPPAVRDQQPVASRSQPGQSSGAAAATPREVWDRWTRSDASGGVLVQATLRSERELRAEIEADRGHGASEAEVREELARRMVDYRFATTSYVSVYLKNLAPGYPAYLDDLPARFHLRDSSGKEVLAFLPPGHDKDRRIFSFGTGAPGDLLYEASVTLAFDRAGLSTSTSYLQLVVSDVGAASRRVLTWELE